MSRARLRAILAAPIGGVGLRHARAARAIMAVPETAVDENRELAAGVDDVRLARQIGAMEPVARRDRAQKRAHRKLRAGVARFDRAHDGGAVIGHALFARDAATGRQGDDRTKGRSKYTLRKWHNRRRNAVADEMEGVV